MAVLAQRLQRAQPPSTQHVVVAVMHRQLPIGATTTATMAVTLKHLRPQATPMLRAQVAAVASEPGGPRLLLERIREPAPERALIHDLDHFARLNALHDHLRRLSLRSVLRPDRCLLLLVLQSPASLLALSLLSRPLSHSRCSPSRS